MVIMDKKKQFLVDSLRSEAPAIGRTNKYISIHPDDPLRFILEYKC